MRLGFLFLDTGAMYRAVTLAVLRYGVDSNDEARVLAVAEAASIEIGSLTADGIVRYDVFLDGDEVSLALRSTEVDQYVSQVSSYGSVRTELVRRQRELAVGDNFILVGRDIGTVVLPDATIKLFITATAEERARRRLLEQLARGVDIDYEWILSDIRRRDEFDSNREISPLRPADDALIVDTTDRTPDRIIADLIAMPIFAAISHERI